MSAIKVLIVEDEKPLLKVIVKRLKEIGYIADAAENGEDALLFIKTCDYDIIILDILLPKVSGLEILRQMRKEKNTTPVLMLTALDSVSDKVQGLDAGADDYLAKPFSFDELMARMRVLLRRQSDNKTNVFSIGDLELDIIKRVAVCNGNSIDFTAKEFAVLEYMIRNKGNILTRSQITEHVWEYESDFESNVVDVYIRYIRRKLEKHSPAKLIHTVRGIGYVLKEE